MKMNGGPAATADAERLRGSGGGNTSNSNKLHSKIPAAERTLEGNSSEQ